MSGFYHRGYASQQQLVQGLRSKTHLLNNERAYNAMLNTDRSFYCPKASYEDSPQSLGYGQTISAPHMHAWCIDLLSEFLHPGARVLDVGSGSGIMTAMMGHMVAPNGKAFGIEYVPELVDLAKHNLRADPEACRLLREDVISVAKGDGWKGLPRKGPFDAIHVGAAPDQVPPALLEQLNSPGRMLIPVGPAGSQEMLRIDKDAEGNIKYHKVTDVMYVPLVKSSAH
eukprot:gb/GECH01008748.1/.p1 GENE.gb/GECH01008748.1/~~gb/GECH01008748.1/.p1  ORF type:complete len:227 (+),score=54.66 gb/GECH01008748.1/:1-681(+)